MERKRSFKVLMGLKIIIILLTVIILITDINFFSVIHARESEALPVIKYETYSSLKVSIFYFILIMTAINIIIINFEQFKQVMPYFLACTPIISIILLIFLIYNPHSIIITPTGWPPTHLDVIHTGAIFGIILLISVATDSILSLYTEGFLKKYLFYVGILFIALLTSDFIHESGHAFFVLISGGKITQFFPFPVMLGGEFNAGFVNYSKVPSSFEPLVLLGGEIFQWFILGITSVILYLRNPKKPLKLLLAILLILSILDFPLYVLNNSIGLPHWFLIGSTYGDLIMFSALTGFPFIILIIIAIIQLILGGILLYSLIYKQRDQFFN